MNMDTAEAVPVCPKSHAGMSATLSNIKESEHTNSPIALFAALLEPIIKVSPAWSECSFDGCRLLDRNLNCMRVLQYPSAAWARSDPESVALLAKETTDAGHSILVFCPSRAVCEWVAEMISKHLGELPEKPSKERADTAAAAAAAAALAAIEADIEGLPPPPAHTPGTRAAIMDQLMQVQRKSCSPAVCFEQMLPEGTSQTARLATRKSRRLSENKPTYAPCLHFKSTHPQPFDLIGTFFALKCSWRYKLPGHMLRFVSVALCAEIDWTRAHIGHVNPNYGELAEIATKHQPLGLFTCYRKCYQMDPSFKVPGYGDHMQRSMQKTHNVRPQKAPSGIIPLCAWIWLKLWTPSHIGQHHDEGSCLSSCRWLNNEEGGCPKHPVRKKDAVEILIPKADVHHFSIKAYVANTDL
eukprot:1137470-Pelagomonas_calceolata.AAC.4